MAEASGPTVTGAGGSVGVEKGFRPVSGIAGAGGPTGAGGPVVAGTRFLAVADVYAPFEETKGDPRSDIRKFDQISETITEVTSSQPLGHAGVQGDLFQKMAPITQTRTRSGEHWARSKWGFHLCTGHRMGETNRLMPTARKIPRREMRLWLAWWGQRHPGSSRD